MRHRSTYRITLAGLLLAMMLVLGFVESMLPAVGPVPGIKLGLSNGVLIFAVYMLDLPTAWILMSLKVVLSGLLFSGVSAMMYAFAGGVLSLAAMSLLSRIRALSPVTVSVSGGALHNVGQVLLAMLILHTPGQMLYYMAVLILVGMACGGLTGVAARQVMKHLTATGWKRPDARNTKDLRPVFAAAALTAAAALLIWLTQ